MNGSPAFLFYPGDHLRDPQVRRCSLAARGLWIDLVCLAHFNEPYGELSHDGKPWTVIEIENAIGGQKRQLRAALAELEAKGVVSRNADGALFSRRMVADAERRAGGAERSRKHRKGKAGKADQADDRDAPVTDTQRERNGPFPVPSTLAVTTPTPSRRRDVADTSRRRGRPPPITGPEPPPAEAATVADEQAAAQVKAHRDRYREIVGQFVAGVPEADRLHLERHARDRWSVLAKCSSTGWPVIEAIWRMANVLDWPSARATARDVSPSPGEPGELEKGS